MIKSDFRKSFRRIDGRTSIPTEILHRTLRFLVRATVVTLPVVGLTQHAHAQIGSTKNASSIEFFFAFAV